MDSNEPRQQIDGETSGQTVVFIVERDLYYKFMGPLILECASQGFSVVLLHNGHRGPSIAKGSSFPLLSYAPIHFNQKISARYFYSRRDLSEQLASLGHIAIVSLHAPITHGLNRKQFPMAKWIMIQHFADSFFDLAHISEIDWFCTYTAFWWEQIFKPLLGSRVEVFDEKMRVTGCPMLDFRASIDRRAINRKYSLPENSELFTYFAIDHPAFMGLERLIDNLWMRFAFVHPYPNKSFVNRIERLGTAISTRFHSSELSILKHMQAQCEKNGLILAVKTRSKRMILMPDETMRLFYDESLIPPTSLELLSISKGVLATISTVEAEAMALGVPTFQVRLRVYRDLLKRNDSIWGRLNACGFFENAEALTIKELHRFTFSALERDSNWNLQTRGFVDRFIGDVGASKRCAAVIADGLSK